jgi:two-component system chemotaxis response regulator CheY
MRNQTILVVDDDSAVCSFVQTVLTRAGFRVQLACSGEAGLALYHEAPADAVLLDLNLPDACGLDVLAVLRAFNPNVRCAMMHGGSTDHSDDDLLAAGAVEVVLKPFSAEKIVEVASRLTMASSTVQ